MKTAAFFFPSLYEGFGRPPLEAAVAGAPLVVSDIPVHREALAPVKSGVTWVKPKDLKGWADAFSKAQCRSLMPIFDDNRHRVLETYSLEQMGSRSHRLYCRALGLDTEKGPNHET